MRNRVCIFVLLGVALAVAPASGAKQEFSRQAFQIFGGMGGGDVKSSLLHKTVSLSTDYERGTVIVRTGERKLYYVLSGSKAVEYHVGVGREGFTWTGTDRISRKTEWPDWRPPHEMIEREAARGRSIPKYVRGGADNPLGARAIYIGDTEFRIHGTTEPWSIGLAVSSGCIRMLNEEVIDLYNRVEVGATVVVE